MATSFDPPWSPEVVEVPLDDGDKVVLVIRIDPGTVPGPIVLDGSIPVRLDVRASRAMMAAMLTQGAGVQSVPHLGHATRGPGTHRTPISTGSDVEQSDLILRTVTGFQLHSSNRRSRLATGMPARIIAALQRTQLTDIVSGMGLFLQEGKSPEVTAWQVVQATSRDVVLEMSSTAQAPEDGRRTRKVLCRVTAAVADFGLEVCCDLVLWLDEVVLPWDLVQHSFLEMVPAVANTLLPETVTATIGSATLLPPIVEIHLSTHRWARQDLAVESVVDVSTIGVREGQHRLRGAGEVLDETLIDGNDWTPAVIDALTVMAMDWGFPAPDFQDQGLSGPA